MNILIVAVYFPPQNSIASLRPYSWAKWWSREGHNVTVLTTAKKNRTLYSEYEMEGFHVIEVPVPVISKLSTNIENEKLQEKRNETSANSNKKISLKQHLLNLYHNFARRTGCFYTCRFPDWHDLWINAAKKYLLKKNFTNKWDLLVTTGGPYSVHRIGPIFKRTGKVDFWICDWRDPWPKNQLFNGLFIFWPYEYMLANKFHKYADCITVVSPPIAKEIQKITKTKVISIPNGFDKNDYNNITEEPHSKLRFVYTGSIYAQYQSPETFFKAMGNLYSEGIVSKDNVEILFAGNNADVSDMAKKYGIQELYKYEGFIPREKALELQKSADILLFLEFQRNDVAGCYTGKIFEYLYIAKEIWAIGNSGPESGGDLIIRANAGIRFFDDFSAIELEIKKILLNKRVIGMQKDMDYISKFERETLAALMLGLKS